MHCSRPRTLVTSSWVGCNCPYVFAPISSEEEPPKDGHRRSVFLHAADEFKVMRNRVMIVRRVEIDGCDQVDAG